MSSTMTAAPPYRGRFAPTPSGPLHLGSLVTALGSFLQAKARLGKWLLRIDDLDTPRVIPGAEARILGQLEAHGLLWDEALRRQSVHVEEYRHYLHALETRGLLYWCDCTRARLKTESAEGPDGAVYSGRCRNRVPPLEHGALRLKLSAATLALFEPGKGMQHRNVERDVGDFVLQRSDGQIAYQLASAVDEQAMGITEVVRGADLLGSSFRQLYLADRLGFDPPAYRHLPVIADTGGRKLSKQNGAIAIAESEASRNLHKALALLGQEPLQRLSTATVHELIAWAVAHWDPERIRDVPILMI